MRVYRRKYKDAKGKRRTVKRLQVEFDDHLDRCQTFPAFEDEEASEALGRTLDYLVLCRKRSDAPGLVLLDWMMPGIDGVELCRKLRKRKALQPAYVIIVTTRDNKQDLVEGLAAGANDYIGKPFDNDELRARIEVGQRVLELEEKLARRVRELEDALEHVKTLQGILPICIHCHKIRNDKECWERIEKYIMEHTDAEFTHGLCPECARKHYPKYYGND